MERFDRGIVLHQATQKCKDLAGDTLLKQCHPRHPIKIHIRCRCTTAYCTSYPKVFFFFYKPANVYNKCHTCILSLFCVIRTSYLYPHPPSRELPEGLTHIHFLFFLHLWHIGILEATRRFKLELDAGSEISERCCRAISANVSSMWALCCQVALMFYKTRWEIIFQQYVRFGTHSGLHTFLHVVIINFFFFNWPLVGLMSFPFCVVKI